MKKQNRISNMGTAGFSLIEVLITVGLIAFISLAMAGNLSYLHTQTRGISQKQEALELKNMMTQQLTKTGVCTWQLKDKIIDVSMPTSEAAPSPTVLNLPELYMGLDSSSALLAKSGQLLPQSLSRVKVSDIRFKDIYATGNPNEFKGVFQISFDSDSLVQAMKPVQIQLVFSTNSTDPPNSKRISNCMGISGNAMKAECAVAAKRGKVPGAYLINHTFSAVPLVEDVFNVHEYPGGGSAWGLSCKSPYVPTTCSGSELGGQGSMGPDVWQMQYGQHGCYSDDEELGGVNPTVYLTCCQYTVK